MRRFKKIVFIADGSKGEAVALNRVLELVTDNKASLCLLDVVEPYPDARFFRAGLGKMSTLHSELVKTRKAELKSLLEQSKKNTAKVKTTIKIREGKSDIEIIRQVLDRGHDLVVKVSSGHSRITGMRLGTLDMSLLRKCPCPVMIMKPARKIHHSRILAAIDLTHLPDDSNNLDRSIMDLATSLARMEEGKLHVLHAWKMPYEKILQGESRIMFYKTVADMVKELRRVEKKHLEAMAALYSEFNPQVHMVKGEPAHVIPAFATKHKIDLIVMGTLARLGVEGMLIGNTAEKILSQIDCSVLALKPDGFVSPVSL